MIRNVDFYLALIAPQHRDKPQFVETVRIRVGKYVEIQQTLLSMRREFDIDDAIGVQLDQVGEWVGRARFLSIPLESVYFSWAISELGWGEASWKGVHDPDTGVERLPDDVFRQLLKAKVAANQWNGTIPGAYEVYEIAFKGTDSVILIDDHQDMSMTVCIAGTPPDMIMRELLKQGYLPLKPESVRIKDYITTLGGGVFFAWDCDTDLLKGWGEGHWPVSLFDYVHYPEEYEYEHYLFEENGNILVREDFSPDAEDLLLIHDEKGNIHVRTDLPALAHTLLKCIDEQGNINLVN